MSFGFGVGDFLAVAKLANDIWQKLHDSVGQFADIRDEVKGYSSLLYSVSKTISNQYLAPEQAEGLDASARACRSVLEDLQKLVDKYRRLTNEAHGLTANVRQKAKKLQWDQDDARDLRARITSTSTVLRGLCETIATDQQARKELCQWLSPLDFPAQQRGIYSRPQQESGRWLLQSERFKKWLQNEGVVLLCPGSPGAGKTVLASIVIDHLWNRVPKDGIGVAYIYCDYLKHGEQTPINLVGSLLKQLAEQQNPISGSLKNYYDEHRRSNTNPSPERAFEVFKAECDSWSRIYIIIDALDECSENDATRQIVVKGLLSLQGSKRINILVTSRPIPSILCNFETWERLEIRADSEDIHRYLLGQMDRFSKRILAEKDLQAKIIGGIIDAADGMFLLARLTFNTLVGHKTVKAIKGTLAKLSKGAGSLDLAYDDAMKRIEDQDSDDRNLAKKTLLWISQGQRPLTGAEMQQAVAIELGDSDLDLDSTVDCDDIISACTGLVTRDRDFRGDDVLRLVHYTTQEYLERTKTKYFPTAQEYLASSCLTYLLFDVFSGASCPILDLYYDTGDENDATEVFCFGCKECWNAEQNEEEREESGVDWELDACRDHSCSALRSKQYPFYHYAAWHWGHHAENCDDEAIHILTKTFLDDCKRVSGALRFVLYHWPYNPENLKLEDSTPGSAIQLPAYLGLTKLLSKRLEDGSEPDLKDKDGRTPLFWAVVRGHEDVVKLLMMREDVNPNVKDRTGETPLIEAVKKSDIAVVQVLLACEHIDINAKDVAEGWSALFHAIYAERNGPEQRRALQILKLLLACDNIKVNVKNKHGKAPLMIASAEGLQLLLAHGHIQVNERDNEGQTALHIVALREDAEGMRVLLAHGDIQINKSDNNGRTALHIAAQRDWAQGIQLLLAHGDIQANIRDNKGQTALNEAAKKVLIKGMRLLLAHGNVQVNATDDKGQTALHIVARRDQRRFMGLREWETGMQLLLAHHDSQVNATDNMGRTALHIAARQDWTEGMRLLLAHRDIQVSVRDDDGLTALHNAVPEGMRLLLGCDNIDVNVKDECGSTALHLAAEFLEIEKVLLLLVRDDLEVNVTDDDGESALFRVVKNAYDTPILDVAELFLARGDVDLNIRDKYGRAPLYHAVRSGQPGVVQLFLTREDLEINIEDGEGGRLVSLAEDERDKAEEGMKSDAYNAIINLLRSYSCKDPATRLQRTLRNKFRSVSHIPMMMMIEEEADDDDDTK